MAPSEDNPADASSTSAAEEFIIDPFAGDINPGTTRESKLFLEATAPVVDLSKRLTATVENQHEIVSYIKRFAARFHFGSQVLRIKCTRNGAATDRSLLSSSQEITVNECILQASRIWGGVQDGSNTIPTDSNGAYSMKLVDISIYSTSSDAEKKVFFSRVRSQIISKFIRGHFSDVTIQDLEIHRHYFEWSNDQGIVMEDGATMLKLLFDEIKPTVKTGIKEFRDIITGANASKYKENVS